MSSEPVSSSIPRTDSDSDSTCFDRRLTAIEARWRGLPDKPEETPRGTLRALWFTAAAQPRSSEHALEGDLPVLDDQGVRQLDELIERRMTGVPLAYLTGFQRFMGLEFRTGSSALIPRKETEILGMTALDLLRQLVRERRHASVIDLCTGSGNLAIALTVHEPDCRTFAADLCPKAVALARSNAEAFNLRDRIEFRVGDLFAPFAEESLVKGIDLIVCNPPYISSAKVASMPHEISAFEPALAFDAGAFGLKVLGRLIKEAPHYLKPASWLCFEVGAGQGQYLATSMERMKEYSLVRKVSDSKGEVRALAAQT